MRYGGIARFLVFGSEAEKKQDLPGLVGGDGDGAGVSVVSMVEVGRSEKVRVQIAMEEKRPWWWW